MPCIETGGFVDLRLLNITINLPICLHYIVRHSVHDGEPQLLFILREVDTKILRSSTNPASLLQNHNRTEQCIRTVVNLVCKGDHVWATHEELKALKAIDMLFFLTILYNY